MSHCHHTTLSTHHTVIKPHCHHTTLPSHQSTISPHCHHITLPSHYTAITPHCHHKTLSAHHTAITPHYHHTTLPSHYTPITPHSHYTTLPSHHTAITQYLTSRYLMRATRLLQAVTSFMSGRPEVKNSVFLCCVTRTFEHSIIWTQETTGHFMNSEEGNILQKEM